MNFCSQCSDGILSCEILSFWKIICFNSIFQDEWFSFEKGSNPKYLSILENQGYLMTLDHESSIFIKVIGIYETSDEDSYLICLNPSIHFQEGFN